MSYTFSPLIRFLWRDHSYVVQRHLADDLVVIEALTTGIVQTVARRDLEQALFAGELCFEIQGRQARPDPVHDIATHYHHIELDDCTPQQQQMARLRLAVIEPLLALPPPARSRERVQARIDEVRASFSAQALANLGCQQLSRATIYRWLKHYRDSAGSIRGLIPQTQRCGGRGQSRLDPLVDQLIETYFAELLHVRTRRTITHIYDELCLRIQELNATRPLDQALRPPSKTTVARRYHAYRQQPASQPRSEQQYQAFEMPLEPLERVEIDHTLTDLIVIDDDDHLPLGRLALTLCVDVKTRYPLGYYFGFERYSYQAISECLYHAIQPKHSCERYGTQHEWLAYGIPSTLVTDNGSDFRSKNLEDACQLLGIQLQRTPLRSPHLKPFIERMFATCNTGFFHIAPGTTFSNVLQRGDYNSEKMACVYLSQIDQAFNRFLIDLYAESYHTGLGDIPARQWQQALQQGFVPRLPANAEELHVLLGQVFHRRIRRSGIQFAYLRYNSPSLLRLRLKLEGRAAKIKYHPSDLSVIYAYDPFERRYLTVPALDQAYTRGLSLWKHRQIVHRARQVAHSVDRTQLAQARRDLQAIFETGAGRRRRHRHKLPLAPHPESPAFSSRPRTPFWSFSSGSQKTNIWWLPGNRDLARQAAAQKNGRDPDLAE